jgi:hypothetical protein
MATLKGVLAVIEQHIGFSTSRTKQIARRLAEADIIPTGGPRRAPEIDTNHFVSLVAAAAMDDGLADVVASHHRLSTMTPGGAMLSVDLTVSGEPTEHWPTAVPRSARQVLDVIAEMALGDLDSQRDVAAMRLEFVSSWPEITIYDGDRTRRFREPGSNAGHWGERGHRRSVTINGGAFVDAVRSLFHR